MEENENAGQESSTLQHSHIYVCPETLPDPDTADAAQFLQRVQLLSAQIDHMNQLVWKIVTTNAPVLERATDINVYIMGVGFLAQGLAITTKRLLEHMGVEPLNYLEDQRRLIRDQLDRPDCPVELREHLLDVLGWLNNQPDAPATATEETEWPEGGFTIGGE